MNIAIIGYGSIGQRHEKNCLELGHNVDVLSRHMGRKLKRDEYDLVIICSRTFEHLSDVKKFRHLSVNFLIEKPIASTYKEAMEIKNLLESKKVRVGYCLIFSPIIERVKKIISKKILGEIYFAQIYAGSYLPNWRAGEDYKKRYSAKAQEGGGVALDLIHEINFTQFFFQEKISKVYAYQAKLSDLEIDSNDFAHFALTWASRYATITLNYFESPAIRYIKMIGQKGILFADLVRKNVEIINKNGRKTYSKQFDFDHNQMYIDEAKSMIKFMNGREKQQEILSMDQAIYDLEIIEGLI